MDAAATAAVARELRGWEGARIDRVQQPAPDTISLGLRGTGGPARLGIFLRPDLPRLHLTATPGQSLVPPPGLCLALRKWLEGARLQRVSHPPWERWLVLSFEGRSSLGDRSTLLLRIDLIPGATNLVLSLAEGGRVLAAWRAPGAGPAGPGALLPDEVTGAALEPLLTASGPAWRALVGQIAGFGPVLAREALYRSGADPAVTAAEVRPQAEVLARTVRELADEVNGGRFEPAVYYTATGRAADWHVVRLAHLAGLTRVPHPTPSRAADAFYVARLEEESWAAGLARVRSALSAWRRRLAKKLTAQEQELERADLAATYQLWGELLTAFADRVPPGAGAVALPNYYLADQPEVTVPLDPARSARSNAQVYFGRAAKARRTARAAAAEVERTRADLQYLEQLSATVETCRTPSDLQEVEEELAAAGLVRPGCRHRGTRSPDHAFTGLRLLTSGGEEVLVGKNHRQNEQLLRLARPDDVWLHARGVPGAHVLLRRGSAAETVFPPPASLEEAAELAAHFSRAHQAAWVEVDWTRVRYVRKPRGGRPGLVLYDHEETLRVSPAARLLRRGEPGPPAR